MSDERPDRGPYFEGVMQGTDQEIYRCPVCGIARKTHREIEGHYMRSHAEPAATVEDRARAIGLVVARR